MFKSTFGQIFVRNHSGKTQKQPRFYSFVEETDCSAHTCFIFSRNLVMHQKIRLKHMVMQYYVFNF